MARELHVGSTELKDVGQPGADLDRVLQRDGRRRLDEVGAAQAGLGEAAEPLVVVVPLRGRADRADLREGGPPHQPARRRREVVDPHHLAGLVRLELGRGDEIEAVQGAERDTEIGRQPVVVVLEEADQVPAGIDGAEGGVQRGDLSPVLAAREGDLRVPGEPRRDLDPGIGPDEEVDRGRPVEFLGVGALDRVFQEVLAGFSGQGRGLEPRRRDDSNTHVQYSQIY
ncbi:hypothetical protein ACU4GA_26210 [Methylobacterium oryzae CBMB20]